MDALLLPLLAAALAEAGDKTMLLAILLDRRFRRRSAVIGGIAAAAFANAAIAVVGGAVVAGLVPHRAAVLMLGLALLGAGLGSLVKTKHPDAEAQPRLGAFGTTAFAFLVHGFGDKTQFIAFAFAASGGAPALAGLGAASGVLAATIAVLIAGIGPDDRALRIARLVSAAILTLAGLWIALGILLWS